MGRWRNCEGLAPLMETANAKGDIGSLAIEVAKQRLKVLRLTPNWLTNRELAVARSPDARWIRNCSPTWPKPRSRNSPPTRPIGRHNEVLPAHVADRAGEPSFSTAPVRNNSRR